MGWSIHNVRKNTEALVIVSKEIGLEVNAERTKYMIMSRDQNASRKSNVMIGNKSFEIVEQFKYLVKTQMIKIPFMKKPKAAGSRGMLVIRCRMFGLPV